MNVVVRHVHVMSVEDTLFSWRALPVAIVWTFPIGGGKYKATSK